MSATLIGNPPVYIIIFGGYTVETVISGSEELEKFKYLNDMWSFSTYSYKWHQIFPNSDYPDKREGSSLTVYTFNMLFKSNRPLLLIEWRSCLEESMLMKCLLISGNLISTLICGLNFKPILAMSLKL